MQGSKGFDVNHLESASPSAQDKRISRGFSQTDAKKPAPFPFLLEGGSLPLRSGFLLEPAETFRQPVS